MGELQVFNKRGEISVGKIVALLELHCHVESAVCNDGSLCVQPLCLEEAEVNVKLTGQHQKQSRIEHSINQHPQNSQTGQTDPAYQGLFLIFAD